MWIFLNGKWVLCAPENEGGAGDNSEGDEPEEGDEPAEGDEPEEGDEPAEGDPQPSRRERRTQSLANQAREEREARIRLEERNRLLEEQMRNPSRTGTADAERVRAEKLALMSPEEKREFLRDEELQEVRRQQNMQAVQMNDFRDEARYDAISTLDTVQGRFFKAHKKEVDAELQRQRQQGRNPTREAIAMLMYADKAFSAKPGKKLQQKKADAASRVSQAKAKPLTARGGAGQSGGGDDLETLRNRILERERLGHAS